MRRTWIAAATVLLVLGGVVGCMKSTSPTAPSEIPVPVYPTYLWQGDGVPCGDPMQYTLIAGQNYDAGFITITLEDGELCIDIETTGGWVMTETHVAVAPVLDSIPQTGSGNPQVGKFLWQTEHDPAVTSAIYCCNPLEYLWEPGEIFIAVHAKVLLLDDAGNPVQEETAWGEGPEFPGRSWATYMNYLVESCPACGITVTYPNGGEEFCLNDTVAITWETTGDPGATVRIELLQDGEGCVVIAEAAPNTGLFEWTAAACGFPEGYTIQITDNDCGAEDASDGPFGVVDCGPEDPPVVTLVLPDLTDLICEYNEALIQWTVEGGPHETVRIDLYRIDGTWCYTIYPDGPPTPDGVGGYQYLWATEPFGAPGDQFRLRITDVASGAYDESDTPFVFGTCGSGGEKR